MESNNNVEIIVKSKDGYNFNVKVNGNYNDCLKGLACAANYVIKEGPEEYQQRLRVMFLEYLNKGVVNEDC